MIAHPYWTGERVIFAPRLTLVVIGVIYFYQL